MKKKIKIKLRKIFQATYLLTFFISAIEIVGNIELDVKTPIKCWIIFIVSSLLCFGKIIYHDLKYPNSKYVWH